MLSVLSQFGVIFKSGTCSVYPLTWVVNTRIGQKPCEHSPFNIFFYADHSLLGHQPILESNLDRVSMAYGYAIGYPKLRICHNDTNTLYCLHSKVLTEVNIYNICCFPHIISLPALIQKKLNWFDIAFSQVSAGCCSLGARVGRVCGCALSAYNFLAFYWHNHSLSLKVFQASAGHVVALKIIFHFRVNTKISLHRYQQEIVILSPNV